MNSLLRRRWALGVAATIMALAVSLVFSCTSQSTSTNASTTAPLIGTLCRQVYDVAFDDCGLNFLDVNGVPFPESQIVNACAVNDAIWGLKGAFAACIDEYHSDCTAMSNCLVLADAPEATPGAGE